MTLEEAIRHCEEVAKSCQLKAYDIERDDYKDLEECAAEHRQLAEWLRELKRLRAQNPCEDAVSREDLIERLNGINGTAELDAVFEIVENMPSAQPESQWIPVAERLPEENGTYLACYEDVTVLLDWFNGKWFFYRTNPAREETETIIAWMPLPEPYREDDIDYEHAVDQLEYDIRWESTFNPDAGSM